MAGASKTVVMKTSAEKLLLVIRNFEAYPEFVEGCHSARVLERQGEAGSQKTRVAYSLEILSKEVHYTLDHIDTPQGVRWELIESNLLKANRGSWTLQARGPQEVEVTYELELEFSIPVPGFLLGGLVKSSLPAMLASFEKRCAAIKS